MLIVRGDAQTLPSELNKAATGEVWFDPIFPKTDGVDVGTVVFSPNGRGRSGISMSTGSCSMITSGYGVRLQGKARPHSGVRAKRHGMDRAQRTALARRHL